MKKNLKIYAGAIVLIGALTSCGVSLQNSLPNESLVLGVSSSTKLSDLPITCQFEEYTLEDGTMAHSLPNDYEPYQVDKSDMAPSVISTVLQNDEYTVYLGDKIVNENGVAVDNSLDGFIGVNKYYVYDLNQLDSLKSKIVAKFSAITEQLTKVDDNVYSLSKDYYLYNLNGYVDTNATYYLDEDKKIYLLSDSEASNYVGISNTIYEAINDLQPIVDYVKDEYYNEKTNSRS